MNVLPTGDQIPLYPPEIHGDLRLILQIKDLFLFCYKYLEEYQILVDEQFRLITKDYVEEQIKLGEREVAELQSELSGIQQRLKQKVKNNEKLGEILASMGVCDIENMNARRFVICRSPTLRSYNKYLQITDDDHRLAQMKEEIMSKLCEIKADRFLTSLLEYYRELFYYQLHFCDVQTRFNHFTMPLVTENIGLLDRIFFWSERPELINMKQSSGALTDRLKEIYSRIHQVLALLTENIQFLRNQVKLQKEMETKFNQCLKLQEKRKDNLMKAIHSMRQDMEVLEEENDRLVGIIVKLDPTFVETPEFLEVAEDSLRKNYLFSYLFPDNDKNKKTQKSRRKGKDKNDRGTPKTPKRKQKVKTSRSKGRSKERDSDGQSSNDPSMQAFTGELIAEVLDDEQNVNASENHNRIRYEEHSYSTELPWEPYNSNSNIHEDQTKDPIYKQEPGLYSINSYREMEGYHFADVSHIQNRREPEDPRHVPYFEAISPGNLLTKESTTIISSSQVYNQDMVASKSQEDFRPVRPKKGTKKIRSASMDHTASALLDKQFEWTTSTDE